MELEEEGKIVHCSGRSASGIAVRTAQKWAKNVKEYKDWNIFEKQTNNVNRSTGQLEERHKIYLVNLYDDESGFDINMRPPGGGSAKGTPAIVITPTKYVVSMELRDFEEHSFKELKIDISNCKRKTPPKNECSKFLYNDGKGTVVGELGRLEPMDDIVDKEQYRLEALIPSTQKCLRAFCWCKAVRNLRSYGTKMGETVRKKSY
ncbi:hypothetical protein BDF20DRAFT_839710 [Mycotypha africana]|uniref:uncharacterized protein n=1 Tax=Mycotypha africana TaxID=64632 RepID=UPI0022FFCEC5|nr:uncharacterized protein BDF20DRAFT_839710 [Mycotypha africana]KAI8967867.1 hypothetical protein BDF20DRAFT_839710 [Mycotypha africana]